MSQSFARVSRAVQIRKGEPIEECGLTFYPIKMSFYEQFLFCKESLLLRQSSLPVKYWSRNYLDAIFAMEMDVVKEKGNGTGLFPRLLLLVAMSLGIDIDLQEYLKGNNIVARNGRNGIELVSFKMTQGEKTVEISPKDFSTKIRPLIALQNGLELPNESDNIELVVAQQEMAKLKENSIKLDQSLDSLISSVAYQSNVRETEIDDWTVREFENRRKAIDRDKHYMLYEQASLSGMVTFKKGNPYPSWCFDAIDDSMGTMGVSELNKQTGGQNIKT